MAMATDQGANNPPPKKSGKIWYILGGIFIGILVLCGGGVGGVYFYADYANKKTAEERQKRVEADPGIDVTAHEIAQAYSIDVGEVGDEKYKDKVVVVSGQILKMDHNTVTLSGHILLEVDCEFGKANAGQLAGLKPGMDVTLKGVCTGKSFFKVNIKECKLVN